MIADFISDTIKANIIHFYRKDLEKLMHSSCIYSDTMVDYRRNIKLKKYGVSFHWWGNLTTSMHYHNFYEFFIITQGKAKHEINGNISFIPKNTLYMIRPEDCHQFTKLNISYSKHINICVTRECMMTICKEIGTSIEKFSFGKMKYLELSERDMVLLVEYANKIESVNKRNLTEISEMEYALVKKIITLFCNESPITDFECPDWFKAIIKKIHSSEFLSCSAADIYSIGGFSAPVMIDYFKAYTNKTVSEYLRSVKIEYAKNMLCNTCMTTLEIAGNIGYDSLSHFNRMFKKYTGLPPGEYRNKHVRM